MDRWPRGAATAGGGGAWRRRPARELLRIPIGVGEDGQAVVLDLKEAARSGHGPHGLVVGTAGSGRSELLRTVVLALAMTHAPDDVNAVLVDVAGAGTFGPLAGLPHVAAHVDRLDGDPALADRLYQALYGELTRRQNLFREAKAANWVEYGNARAGGEPLPPLLVVVDAFTELLALRPDFVEIFVMIGRLGRSLGVHMLLATRRLDEGTLRGLASHLSYRIALRTHSAMESRTAIGVPDAYELPSAPGSAYLRLDFDSVIRCRVATVSGPARGHGAGAARARIVRELQPFVAEYVRPEVVDEPADSGPPDTGERLLDAAVARLAGHGRPAHRIWLPPLDEPPALGALVPVAADPSRGLTTADPALRDGLHATVAVVDRPFEHRREPLRVDLSGAAGHVAIVGAPGSGKTTLLRTLVASLALSHTPRQVQFYGLDLTGWMLRPLARLPHVGGVAAGRRDGQLLRRTVAELTALLERREAVFGEHGIDSMAAYRRLRAAGEVPDDGYGDVFLVVTDWRTLRDEFEELAVSVTDIAARGLGHGLHLIATADRWMDFRPNVRDLLGTRLELRLGDPMDSEVDRKQARWVPEDRPGRGITREGHHFLAALPRLDPPPNRAPDGEWDEAADEGTAAALAAAVAAEWNGPAAPEVRVLPTLLPEPSLVEASPPVPGAGGPIPIGIGEDTLAPVALDFAAAPHFLVIGESECGKTNLLRLIAKGVADRYTSEQARIVVLDYRKRLVDVGGTGHCIGYAPAASVARKMVEDVTAAFRQRLPSDDPGGADASGGLGGLGTGRPPDRSWTGPDLFLIVDDYELVAHMGNPLAPLMALLPYVRDIGLHLVIARSSGGAGRGMFDPVLTRVRESGSPMLVMSGSRDEGILAHGVRAEPLPAGRGTLAGQRTKPVLVQTAYVTPDVPDGAAPPPS
ncbi:type VII secretion protein EccCb [Actinomadura fibrosa]|uniref:type VII secretion protein EccCb n=1 Tax=Actinomadura fibrosa TaxID=111802 RepID=UPI0010418DAD|nr:type VII secretion protein EccCb [Actinomadura fibrosa]